MLFDGPAGKLEGELSEVPGAEVAAVLCHPHPQMGGNMHDLVVSSVHDELERQGVTTLRFNYRGVGASEGSYDNGHGETDDTVAAVQWLKDNSHARQIILAGYSFGGVMAIKASAAALPDALLLVAPAVSMAWESVLPDVPTIVILAKQDQFVNVDETVSWFGSDAMVETLDTDHFFAGQHGAIGEKISGRFGQLIGTTG